MIWGARTSRARSRASSNLCSSICSFCHSASLCAVRKFLFFLSHKRKSCKSGLALLLEQSGSGAGHAGEGAPFCRGRRRRSQAPCKKGTSPAGWAKASSPAGSTLRRRAGADCSARGPTWPSVGRGDMDGPLQARASELAALKAAREARLCRRPCRSTWRGSAPDSSASSQEGSRSALASLLPPRADTAGASPRPWHRTARAAGRGRAWRGHAPGSKSGTPPASRSLRRLRRCRWPHPPRLPAAARFADGTQRSPTPPSPNHPPQDARLGSRAPASRPR